MRKRARPAAVHVRRAIAVLLAIAAALAIKHELGLGGFATTFIGLLLIVLAILISDQLRPPTHRD